MITLHNISNYLQWQLHARTKQGHRVHSPFLFSLITNRLHKPMPIELLTPIKEYRHHLLADKKILKITDLGSGSAFSKNSERRICDIARHSSTSAHDGLLLYNLATAMQCRNILELGTNLGLGTLYLAQAAAGGKVVTIEGCPNLSAKVAQEFEQQGFNNIKIINSDFADFLPNIGLEFQSLDFVFFDGNHRGAATTSYFEQCLPLAHNNSVFVFDDIHKNADMELAWRKITENERVTLSVDFYRMGVIFFRRQLSKQTICLRY